MTDTDLPVGATKPTILVDWDTISQPHYSEKFFGWLHARGEKFNLALLVCYPDMNDFNDSGMGVPNFDVVIRNSGHKRELEFKLNALSVLEDVSISKPVAVLDGSYSARVSFGIAGLITLSDVGV